MKVEIELIGCDDTTIIEDIEVTEEQYKLLVKIAYRSEEESSYACMPIMKVNITE